MRPTSSWRSEVGLRGVPPRRTQHGRRDTQVKSSASRLFSVAVAGLLSLMLTWWSSPIDRVNGNQFTSVFDQRGVVPIGYAVFAFVLGVTAGLLIRRHTSCRPCDQPCLSV